MEEVTMSACYCYWILKSEADFKTKYISQEKTFSAIKRMLIKLQVHQKY